MRDLGDRSPGRVVYSSYTRTRQKHELTTDHVLNPEKLAEARLRWLVGELVEVAVASGGDEGGEEDGEVVTGVDEG